jgi:hypothetical protein
VTVDPIAFVAAGGGKAGVSSGVIVGVAVSYVSVFFCFECLSLDESYGDVN